MKTIVMANALFIFYFVVQIFIAVLVWCIYDTKVFILFFIFGYCANRLETIDTMLKSRILIKK